MMNIGISMCLAVGRGTVFKQEVASKGRQLLNESVDAIKMITPEMIQNSMEIPFADFRETTKALTKPNVGNDVVAQYVVGATGFWTYVFGIAKENRKILSQMRGEMLSVGTLHATHGTDADIALAWIAKATERLVDTLMVAIERAVMTVSSRLGEQLNRAYRRGEMEATETILLAYIALLEVVISDPKEISFSVDVSRELAKSLQGIEIMDDKQRTWVCNYMELQPVTLRDVLLSINFATQLTMGWIFERFNDLMRNVFTLADNMMGLKPLVDYATTLSTNDAIPAEHQTRLHAAVDNMDKQHKRMSTNNVGTASPWLVARVARQVYYDQNPDQDAMKTTVEQRLGSNADDIINGIIEARELLLIEIHLALHAAGSDDNNENQKAAEAVLNADLIGGGWDLILGKKEKEIVLTEEEEKQLIRLHGNVRLREAIARRKPNGVFVTPRTVDAIAQKRATLEKELDEALADLEQISAKHGTVVDIVYAANMTELIGSRRAAKAAVRSGGRGTIQNQQLAFSKDQDQQMQAEVYGPIADAKEAVAQIDWEIGVLTNQSAQINAEVVTSTRRWTMIYFMVLGFGMMIYMYFMFHREIHNFFPGSWAILRDHAEKQGVTPTCQYLENLHRTTQPSSLVPNAIRDLYQSPSRSTVTTLAGRVMGKLNPYVDAGAKQFRTLMRDGFIDLVEAIKAGTNRPEVRELARAVTTAINTASQNGATPAQRADAVEGVYKIIELTTMILSGNSPADFMTFAKSFASNAAGLLTGAWTTVTNLIATDPKKFANPLGLMDLAASTASSELIKAVEMQLMANIAIAVCYPSLMYIMVTGFAKHTAMFWNGAFSDKQMMEQTVTLGLGTLTAITPFVTEMFKYINLAVEANVEARAFAFFKFGMMLLVAFGSFGFGPAIWMKDALQKWWSGRKKTPQELPAVDQKKSSGPTVTVLPDEPVTNNNNMDIAYVKSLEERERTLQENIKRFEAEQARAQEEFQRQIEEQRKEAERLKGGGVLQLEDTKPDVLVVLPKRDVVLNPTPAPKVRLTLAQRRQKEEDERKELQKDSGGTSNGDDELMGSMICSQCDAPAAWNCNHCGGARKYCSDACFKKQWDNSKGTHL